MSKVKVVSVINDLVDPDIEYLENHFSYDDALKGSCFLIYQEDTDGSKTEVPIKLRADTASSQVGVYVGDICKRTPPPDPAVPTNIGVWMHGYADNGGGGFKTESSLSGTFDATGALTGTDISTSPYKSGIDAAKTKIDAITTLTPVKK
jgi:hypothetical protein